MKIKTIADIPDVGLRRLAILLTVLISMPVALYIAAKAAAEEVLAPARLAWKRPAPESPTLKSMLPFSLAAAILTAGVISYAINETVAEAIGRMAAFIVINCLLMWIFYRQPTAKEMA